MSTPSDTPETDQYAGTHETHRIDGLTIYERAQKLERERDYWKDRFQRMEIAKEDAEADHHAAKKELQYARMAHRFHMPQRRF